jgi:hypothetical protein
MAKRPQSHPKLQTAVVFSLLLFLFILSVSFMFPCKHCQDGFSALSVGGLTRHQNKCQGFLKHEAAAIERRKATVISMKARRTKLKGCVTFHDEDNMELVWHRITSVKERVENVAAEARDINSVLEELLHEIR